MKIITIVLGGGIIASFIILAIAFIFLKNQLKPIKKLAKSATNFGRGLDTGWYKPEGAKEIRIAGTAFCEMTKRVNELMNNRMMTLAGIFHDLRTPLTKMKLQLSLMSKTKETKWLLSDVNIMIKMVESFTLHASEQNKENFVTKNLLLFINEIVRDYTSNNFKVHIRGDKDIELSMKYVSLKRAFGNIVANAKKYAKNLYIKFEIKANEIVFYFEDDGKGINEASAQDLFSPFVKQDPARTHGKSDTCGVGLGLSIARDVVIAHCGQISACNSKTYKGACFIITIPCS
jgi:two-component system osmolarity sensor histidine kinase EnvZ